MSGQAQGGLAVLSGGPEIPLVSPSDHDRLMRDGGHVRRWSAFENAGCEFESVRGLCLRQRQQVGDNDRLRPLVLRRRRIWCPGRGICPSSSGRDETRLDEE
jgi:hypothetical protein